MASVWSHCACRPGGRGHHLRTSLTQHVQLRSCEASKLCTSVRTNSVCTIHWLIQKQQRLYSSTPERKISAQRQSEIANVPNSRNPSLIARDVFHFQSASCVFPSWANPDDATTHMGSLWEKLWVRQAGASRKIVCQLVPILFLHSSSSHTFDPLPVWILHHSNPLTFAPSWPASLPAAFDTCWRK